MSPAPAPGPLSQARRVLVEDQHGYTRAHRLRSHMAGNRKPKVLADSETVRALLDYFDASELARRDALVQAPEVRELPAILRDIAAVSDDEDGEAECGGPLRKAADLLDSLMEAT
jgi:hypothetical protein